MVPLTAQQLREVNAVAAKLFTPFGGHVIAEPKDNAYGRYKILARTDGLVTVHAKHLYPGGPVFWTEKGARAWADAKAKSEAVK
jgi:hypothetical protein